MASVRAIGLLLAACLATLSAQATTFSVCESGCDFTSLQAAHNAAAANDFLDVQGPITEAGIVLTKNINLTSSLAERPIVQAASEPGVAVDRIFFVSSGIQVSIDHLVIRHGVRSDAGGAIGNLGQVFITDSRIESNEAATDGGAIFSQGASALVQVTDSTLEANRAFEGGAILCDSGGVIVDRSTLARNRAFEGGGIMSVGSCSVQVRNSTLSLNVAPNGGGGIFNDGGSVVLTSSTLAGNDIRAIQNNGAGSFAVRNSILADSFSTAGLPGGNDCAVFSGGVITDDGWNLVERPGSCSFGAATSLTGIDPALGPLAFYASTTPLHVLTIASPALGAGDSGVLNAVDQRGVSRPQGASDDIGAFEFRSAGEPTRPLSFWAPVFFGGDVVTVEFDAYSTRSPGFAVQIQQSDGSFLPFAPDFFHHATYWGRVADHPGAVASGLYYPSEGDLRSHVIFEDGGEWVMEEETAFEVTGTVSSTSWPQLVPLPGGTGSSVWAAEVGVDIPHRHYDDVHASDPDDAVALIEHSVLSANLVHVRDAGVLHRVGRVILRGDAGQDPYPATGPAGHGVLLDAVRSQWETVLPAGSHDTALVVNNVVAPAQGGAGLAYVGAVASSFAYSSNDSITGGDFSRTWRHEVAHNWKVGHYDGGTPEGPTLNSDNDLGRLSGPEERIEAAYRDTRLAFLDDLGSFPLPVPPRAATDRLVLSSQQPSAVIDVLANDHDANGEALELVDFDSASALGLGGTLSLAVGQGSGGGDALRYTPPTLTGPTSAIDRFTYRIRDAGGQESVGYVFARVVDFAATYQQDFGAFPDDTRDIDDGSFLSEIAELGGGEQPASVQGGSLELTADGQDYTFAAFTLPLLDLDQGFALDFRFRVTSAGAPARGFAVSLGQPVASRIPNTLGGFEEGVSVEFETQAAAAPGLRVRIDGSEVLYDPSVAVADGSWHDVRLVSSPLAELSLHLDGQAIFQDLTGFAPSPEDMLAFSAKTDALSQQTLLDDIDAKQLPEPGAAVALGAGALLLWRLHRRRQRAGRASR